MRNKNVNMYVGTLYANMCACKGRRVCDVFCCVAWLCAMRIKKERSGALDAFVKCELRKETGSLVLCTFCNSF